MVLTIFAIIIGFVIVYFIFKNKQNGVSKLILLITTILVLTLFTTCIKFGYISSGKRYVSVSGYRRKDGIYIQSYKRSYPGEKNNRAGTSYRWLYGIGIIVITLGGIYLAVSYDNAKNFI